MIPLFERAHSLELTETEETLLAYFEANPSAASTMSLQDLSEILYTSNATIVRFCQKLGLHGFHDFKFQLRQELKRQDPRIRDQESLISRSVAQFRDNFDPLDMDTLCHVADVLTSGRPVYIYGQNLSSLPAKYLKIAMTNLDYPPILIDWPELLVRMSERIEADSVLFVVSAHCEPERFLPIFRKVRKRKGYSILLTCSRDNPVLEYTDICLCANDENQEFRHVDFNTRFGILTIIQLLIELMAQKRLK